ncbi:MAG: T9SS type A sorting domain-containing protein [Calditrichaeota bacterium]|nr:T9SS type A sorting domain-containing protein [Calditrichota bacterium]MCB0269704.1 T9SS type A sorting domain-containing protein [Calditrichota bacterium]
MNTLFRYLFLLNLAIVIFNMNAIAQVSENYRLYPSSVTQTEVFVTRHPTNSQLLFATANSITFAPFFVSEGVYVSTNGGDSWFGSDTCKGEPIVFHGGDPGIAIDKNGTFILTRLGTPPFSGVYAHYSTDNGASWSNQITITTDDIERAAIATDASPESPFYGRTYAVFVKFASPFAVHISHTDDGGASWSTPLRINNPANAGRGADITIGKDGTVYVCWAGVTNTSPFAEILTGFAKSSNGGQNWTVQESAFEMSGIQGQLAQKANIRVNGLPRIEIDNSGGARDGWVYIITTEKGRLPAGSDPDVILRRSGDGGQTWSAGIRVNQDVLNNGKIQYFPALHVDDDGGLNAIFYDDRTTTSDSTGVFLARSTDGGDGWTEIEVSDHNFKPVPIGGLGAGYQGDNIDIISSDGQLLPMWMDNSSGTYQIWTAKVAIDAVGIETGETAVPTGFSLDQNYPNPFNPQTNIRYRIAEHSFVKLSIYNILGDLVKSLVSETQAPGEKVILWDGTNQSGAAVASGFYFYKLSAGDVQQTRRMLLIR